MLIYDANAMKVPSTQGAEVGRLTELVDEGKGCKRSLRYAQSDYYRGHIPKISGLDERVFIPGH